MSFIDKAIAEFLAIHPNETGLASGLNANRPAAGSGQLSKYYYATDVSKLYYDTGSAWNVVTPSHADLTAIGVNDHHAQTHATAHQPTGADAMAVDAAAATGSLRTIGTGATQAAAGNDSRLSDSRAPNGTASGELAGTYPSPTVAASHSGSAHHSNANDHANTLDHAQAHASAHQPAGADAMAVDAAAATGSLRTIGTGALQATAGNDSRLSDSRTPTAHEASHKSGGTDALLSTDLLEAIVKRLQESGGPTTLLLGTVTDGEYLKRSATSIISGVPLSNIKQTEIDFGATPVADATFTVTDADVAASSQLIAQVAYEAPTGKDVDEVEMDDLAIRCKPASGSFDMFVRACDGSYLADTFKVNYLIG